MLQEAAAYKKDWQKAQRARLDNGCDEDSYVYLHLNADDGLPHHVGMGYTVGRPWEMNRTKKHKNKVAKHGVRVEIISDELTFEAAKWWEVRWIKALKAAGYELTNLTEGGDGARGYKHTEEYCQIMSNRMAKSNPHHIPEVAEKLSGDNHWTRQDGVITNFHTDSNPSKKIENINRMLYNNPMQNPEVAEFVAKKNRGRTHSAESIELSASKRRGVPKTKEQNLASGAGVKSHWDNLSVDERIARGKKIKAAHDTKTQEERSAVVFKGWETRRRNKLLKEGV